MINTVISLYYRMMLAFGVKRGKTVDDYLFIGLGSSLMGTKYHKDITIGEYDYKLRYTDSKLKLLDQLIVKSLDCRNRTVGQLTRV